MRNAITDAVALRRSIADTFRAVRNRRHMRVQSTADAIAMSIRAYSNIEGARSRASFEDVVLFSQVTGSDLFGVVAAIALNSPDMAVHSADNKISLLIQLLLRDLDASAGVGAPTHKRRPRRRLIGSPRSPACAVITTGSAWSATY